MRFNDVVQLLEQKYANLLEKKTLIEKELNEVRETLESTNYLIKITTKLTAGDPLRTNEVPIRSIE
ncbi:hypothetical protein LSG31_13600 [Fodinisporobacter ferrooxydans]|uniref:Uncharacterized protein n=1 Tax=Fodinisporobacter ferrooxydans TaxID=2901836 RepID=A0ABY4CF20_9BACL|nr:hypothetical protein LSG31_13600 [Alicyclobacillaceae bacterium MYW30-H2]